MPWEYAVPVIGALGGLITVLSAALIKQRNSRSAINLDEDARLYKRLREQSTKQDNRITHLEATVEILNGKWHDCEMHRTESETKVALLENQVKILTGFMRSSNPGLNDDSA